MLMDEGATDCEQEETQRVRVAFPHRFPADLAFEIGESDEASEDDGTQELKSQSQKVEQRRDGKRTPKGQDQGAEKGRISR